MSTVPSNDVDRVLWALRGYDTMALATVSAEGPHVAGVFFAPELTETGVALLVALTAGSRLARHAAADPRVAFMCSPGNPSRWAQGAGVALIVEDRSHRAPMFERLLAHAAGARSFVEQHSAVPAVISVQRVTVVEAAGRQPLVVQFMPERA